MLLFVYANKATTSANAILLQYGEPVYVAIIGSFVLKERPKAEHGSPSPSWPSAWGSSSPAGRRRRAGDGLGNAAAATAGLTFALYTIFMRKQKNGSPLESALLAHVLRRGHRLRRLPLPAGAQDRRAIPRGHRGARRAADRPRLGPLPVGIKRVTAVDASLIGVLEPVFNPLWVFLATRRDARAQRLRWAGDHHSGGARLDDGLAAPGSEGGPTTNRAKAESR